MDRMHIKVLSLWGACMIAPAAVAAPANIVPYFELGTQYDDNLFRVSDDADAIARTGSSDASDFAHRAIAGVAAEWPISRQRFLVSGEFGEYRYSEFDELDHSENRLGAGWDFQVGSAVYGTADVVRSRTLDDFANRDSNEADNITEFNPQVELFVEVSPRWRVRTLVGHLNLEHSLGSQERFNREEDAGLVELQYAGAPGSAWGLGVEALDGEYPDRPANDPLPRAFDQRTVFGSVDYQLSGKSRLFGRIGYTKREAGGGDRDFSEPTGTLGYRRQVSDKTQLTFQAFRRIYSVDNIDAIAVKDTGAAVDLLWDISTRINVTAALEYGNQDYEALPGAAALNRSDHTSRLSTEVAWWPRRMFGVIFELGGEQRDSNQPDEEYDAFYGGVALRLELDSDRALGERLPRVRD